MSSIIGKAVDVELTEHLARKLNVEYLKARAAGRKHSFDQFVNNFGQLELFIGPEAAKEVVSKGEFLDYANGTLARYLAQARIVAGKLGEAAKNVPSAFYSTASLENFLNPATNSQITIPQDVRLWEFRILQENEMSLRYLDSLVERGELSIPKDEHWSASGNSGARGWNIARQIEREIKEIFGVCGFPRPNMVINHGNSTAKISIDAQTRQHLARARDAAYQPQ